MTMDETPQALESATNPEMPRKRRKRTGRKRTVFNPPAKAAWPVRGLWEAAPDDQKKRAHQACMAIARM